MIKSSSKKFKAETGYHVPSTSCTQASNNRSRSILHLRRIVPTAVTELTTVPIRTTTVKARHRKTVSRWSPVPDLKLDRSIQSFKWHLFQLSYVHETSVDVPDQTACRRHLLCRTDTPDQEVNTLQIVRIQHKRGSPDCPDRNTRENSATGKIVSKKLPYDLPSFVVQDVPSPVSRNKFKSHSHRHGIWTKSYGMVMHIPATELTVQNTPIPSLKRPNQINKTDTKTISYMTTTRPSAFKTQTCGAPDNTTAFCPNPQHRQRHPTAEPLIKTLQSDRRQRR